MSTHATDPFRGLKVPDGIDTNRPWEVVADELAELNGTAGTPDAVRTAALAIELCGGADAVSDVR
jgi:hypothetical protein